MKLSYFFLVLLVISSCHERDEFSVRRVIFNETPIPIRVEAYSQGKVVEGFSILPNETNVKDEFCIAERGNMDCDRLTGQDIQWDFFSDSVVVVFNQERIESFCGFISNCTSDERNLILFPSITVDDGTNSGYIRTIEEGVRVFTFTITEEDYQNADLIDG